MFIKLTESFLETFEKSFNSKHEEEMKPRRGLEYANKASYFELKLFSKVSGKLSVDFMNMFKVSERSA